MVTITGVWGARRTRTKTRKVRRVRRDQIARAVDRYQARWQGMRTAVLTWAGFGLVDVAAFEVHLVAGLVTAGASLLVLEWLGRE